MAEKKPVAKEQAVAKDARREELSQDELDAEIGAALPERELMSILPMPDASGAEFAAIVDDLDPDPGVEPEPDSPARTSESAEN